MARDLGVGIIGCGNISSAYFSLAPLFKGIKVLACADLNRNAAELRAEEFGVVAQSIEELLANRDIDVVVNLTIPAAHFPVSKAALEAGKHVYSEKPLVLSLEEGEELQRIAREKKLSVGCAPDTFLGGAHQLARQYIDDGKVGRITSGTCHVMSPGMEMWHRPGLLLPEGRRADPRSRSLLRRQPHQPHRPGQTRRRTDLHGKPHPYGDQPAAEW